MGTGEKITNGIWVLEAKGTNKLRKGTLHAAPMGSGFAGAKAAEENWSDGHNTGGGLFF